MARRLKLDRGRIVRTILPFPTDVLGAVALLGGMALWAVLTPKQRPPAPRLSSPAPNGTSTKPGAP